MFRQETKIKLKKLKIAFVITILIFFASCSTTSKISDKNRDVVEQNKNELSLIFAGDIMAHRPNFSMKDFSKIWKDTKDIIQKSDFAFANIASASDLFETVTKLSSNLFAGADTSNLDKRFLN